MGVFKSDNQIYQTCYSTPLKKFQDHKCDVIKYRLPNVLFQYMKSSILCKAITDRFTLDIFLKLPIRDQNGSILISNRKFLL